MASVTIEGALTSTPTRADGTQYPFALNFPESATFADTRTELVATLLDGYGDIPEGGEGDDRALISRHEGSLIIASRLQEVFAAEAVNQGRWDQTQASEEVLTAIFTPRSEGPAFTGDWSEKVPLVMVATDFAPLTERERITGNVVWIDPFTETTFLQSLHEAGAIELLIQQDAE